MKNDINIKFWLVFLGVIIGVIAIGLLSFTMGNEVTKTAVLDEACMKIYGNEYTWKDSEFGVDLKLVCSKNIIDTETDLIVVI